MSVVGRVRVSDQRPGLEAHRESVELDFPELVSRLRDIVGTRLVAYVGNVRHTRPVGDWAAGRHSPGSEDESRLRLAFQACRLLRDRYGTTTIQTWMMGANPSLGHEAPARVIRESGKAVDVVRDVMAAANAFVCVG